MSNFKVGDKVTLVRQGVLGWAAQDAEGVDWTASAGLRTGKAYIVEGYDEAPDGDSVIIKGYYLPVEHFELYQEGHT